MNEYITADGHMKVERYGRGLRILYATADGFKQDDEDPRFLPGFATSAVREFFRAEEDEQLGRWRWPENPDYVVYPRTGSEVAVLFEPEGVSAPCVRRDTAEAIRPGAGTGNAFLVAARAYFDAHPDPKPWHDAKPGEVWALVYLNEEVPAVASSSESGHFIFTASTNQGGGTEEFRTDSKHITAGRRIWPES